MSKWKLLGKCILNPPQLIAQAKNVQQGYIEGVEVLLELEYKRKEQEVTALEKKYAKILSEFFPHVGIEVGWSLDEKTVLDPFARDQQIRKRSRNAIERTLNVIERHGFEHANVHLVGDVRVLAQRQQPMYERDKKELLGEWKDYLKELPRKKITLENITLLEIPVPPGIGSAFHEIGKLPSDFIQLKTNTTLDIAHAGLTVGTLLDKEKQITGNSRQMSVQSYMGWTPIYWGEEEQIMSQELQQMKGNLKEKITHETIRWLKEIKQKGKLYQVHVNNCRYKNSLHKNKDIDGAIEGDLDFIRVIRAVKKVKPKFLVTEIRETKRDYIHLKNNKKVWEMIKNA